MKEMSRREFMKTVVIGGAALGLGNAFWYKPLEALASGKYDIGECKSVRVKCVSELGWYDDKGILGQLKKWGFKTKILSGQGSLILKWLFPRAISPSYKHRSLTSNSTREAMMESPMGRGSIVKSFPKIDPDISAGS